MHEVEDWTQEVYRAEELAAWPCGDRRFADDNEAQAFAEDAWLRLRELAVESDNLGIPLVVDASMLGPVLELKSEDLGPSHSIELAQVIQYRTFIYIELVRVKLDGKQLAFDEHTMFHELAHGLAEDSAPPHGSEWVGYHLEVVGKLHPQCLDALRSAYEAEGVIWP